MRFLRVPLAAKLAGANLIVVVLAWAAAFAGHDGESRWEMLSVVTMTGGNEAELRAIPRDVAAVLYSVAQEAVANAIRHGRPSRIDVRVGVSSGAVTLQVDDDGTGFDPVPTERRSSATGLFTMRERTLLANGSFDITSTPRGTSVRVRIPGLTLSSENHHAG